MRIDRSTSQVIFSPSDLVRYFASPFSSWMDRHFLQSPETITPDPESDEKKLVAESGNRHEESLLRDLQSQEPHLALIPKDQGFAKAQELTRQAILGRAPVIYQGALALGSFAGYSDFLILNGNTYEVWDSKLARSLKPYFAIQLCCYTEMLLKETGTLSNTFGIILGTGKKELLLTEDFFSYYLHVKDSFLALQNSYTGDLHERPEPQPRADHGRWQSHADEVLYQKDHLIQVAGISNGQIKKIHRAGIQTLEGLALYTGDRIEGLNTDILKKLTCQARLQLETREKRKSDPDIPPLYEILEETGPAGEPVGLSLLPVPCDEDIYFDMEGYPLTPGGLEYLFGAYIHENKGGIFYDWWAHDRAEEKVAFEQFIDWTYSRWKNNPGLHVYHYAAYEVSAVRRLSTRHATREHEVDELLRHGVFVDLYQIVRHGLRIGEESYSIKKVERLYRPKRQTAVSNAGDSIVQYGRWIDLGESKDWKQSSILKGIRDYNEDDCVSTYQLAEWLRKIRPPSSNSSRQVIQPQISDQETEDQRSPAPHPSIAVLNTLRLSSDPSAPLLADLLEFHRRESKPFWWNLFDRQSTLDSDLVDDPQSLVGLSAEGSPQLVKQSLVQAYRFDPKQECKLEKSKPVVFKHDFSRRFSLESLDFEAGRLELKIGKKSLGETGFPSAGTIILKDQVSAKPMEEALLEIAQNFSATDRYPAIRALLEKKTGLNSMDRIAGESPLDTAQRFVHEMRHGALVIQGPPGTGKTYTASHLITSLIQQGKRVGIMANSHHAIWNLIRGAGKTFEEKGLPLRGIKVGSREETSYFAPYPELKHLESSSEAIESYSGGIVAGTAWLFSRPEWENQLDYLMIDEAGQVSLANAIACARSCKNLILLGDHMQLEQPTQGSHPGDSGFSVLQYFLKDQEKSSADIPAYHAVIPSDQGIFLEESRRMHPQICRFISESIYEGGLRSHPDCSRWKIEGVQRFESGSGIHFIGVEHEGNIQSSEEEADLIVKIASELIGSTVTDSAGTQRTLTWSDFLFVAPYNAQVRLLRQKLDRLGSNLRIGSVDKFQGQEAPVCILSLCSSAGEYGSRGLEFILDKNRINVALSRAQCLAIVVGDPRIAQTPVSSVKEIRLLNLFCKLPLSTPQSPMIL